MKYLFCNRINYHWAHFALGLLVSNWVVVALLKLNVIHEAPSPSLALAVAVLIISPAMFLARKRWYPEAHEEGQWTLKWVGLRAVTTAIVFDILARIVSWLVHSTVASFADLQPLVGYGISLAAYVIAAALIGRYLSQRIVPSKTLA
ncbi:hypothetical protein IYR97_26310 (plasmid) [Pseudomonas fulva]|jgi:hypothetical protein|uniref:Uncharacterized protein n=3 Tax=Pseudomonas TaxID=286 RepID=A0A1X0ZN61_PSEPU|nr:MULTISPECIES: hypothetical protein [Pseudomonas]MCT8163954.1 hypothetical protein [Pseudomonas sp. HD6422]MCT8183058.1 hypothetical protein [Pseudomonas sp. HD6421]MDH1930544.1 hypothetical protein [Pseudomonas sp. GD03696]MDM1711671.1 hypothetical protein [Pseudomonas sp. 165]ORL58707.1 hypothetical protein B7H17_24560 [Pseudomonas putida]